MKYYGYNPDSKIFEHEGECQRDPLESELAGRDIWLLPANATYEKPLEEKDGYNIKWNGESWEYEEKPKESSDEIEPYETTELDKLNDKLWSYKNKLYETDYKAIKYAEGLISDEDYAEIKAERQLFRDKINELQAEINKINQ